MIRIIFFILPIVAFNSFAMPPKVMPPSNDNDDPNYYIRHKETSLHIFRAFSAFENSEFEDAATAFQEAFEDGNIIFPFDVHYIASCVFLRLGHNYQSESFLKKAADHLEMALQKMAYKHVVPPEYYETASLIYQRLYEVTRNGKFKRQAEGYKLKQTEMKLEETGGAADAMVD